MEGDILPEEATADALKGGGGTEVGGGTEEMVGAD